MIRVDDRVGSIELLPKLRECGVPVAKERLPFGDFAWTGHGPRGLCAVAVERKKIHDLLDSITSRRLSGHQLPGMAGEYDYVYLLVEGLWRPGPSGELEIRDGTWTSEHSNGLSYRAINGYLSTLEVRAGVIYRRVPWYTESVEVLVDLYRWWQEPWESHHSHEATYAPAEGGLGRRFTLLPRAVSVMEKLVMQFPGLDEKARWVAERFPTLGALVSASEEDLAAVRVRVGHGSKAKWQRLGTKAAKRVRGVIEGGK
jgi:ERCC4-type nuclease